MSQKEKRILFISIGFYDYDSQIIKALEQKNYNVTHFIDRPKLTKINLFKDRVFNKIRKRKKNYFCDVEGQNAFLNSLSDSELFDQVLVIVGRSLSHGFLKCLKEKHCSGNMILYLWDDVARVQNFEEVKECYDHIYSFDFGDCQKYGFNFLPLFFVDDFLYSGEHKDFDIAFIGSDHSERFKIISSILQQTKKYKLTNYIFIHSGAFSNFKRRIRYFWKDQSFVKKDYISFKQTANILKRSKIVIDIPYKNQNGLTIRTFEALASNCKLITTNKNIVNYDFFDPNIILVIDFNSFFLPETFLVEPLKKNPKREIIQKYSVSSWLNNLLK